MFFVDARELGDGFYNAEHHPSIRMHAGIPVKDILDPERNYNKTGNLYLFASWFNDAILPGFARANPVRTDGASMNVLVSQSQTDAEVHRDTTRPSKASRTFLTLGVMPDGSTAGTMFPDETVAGMLEQEQKFTTGLSADYLARHFSQPAERHAAVFDPDLEVHAGPPVSRQRILYRVVVSASLPAGTNQGIPLNPLHNLGSE